MAYIKLLWKIAHLAEQGVSGWLIVWILQFKGASLEKIHGNSSLLRCPILDTLKLRGRKVTLENIGPEDFSHLCKYTTIQLNQQTLELFADFHNLAAASRYSLYCLSELSQASVTHSLTELPKSLEEKWMGMHRSSDSWGLQRDGLQSQNPSYPQLNSWLPPQHGMVKHYSLLHNPFNKFTTMSQRWLKRFLAFAILDHSFPPQLCARSLKWNWKVWKENQKIVWEE